MEIQEIYNKHIIIQSNCIKVLNCERGSSDCISGIKRFTDLSSSEKIKILDFLRYTVKLSESVITTASKNFIVYNGKWYYLNDLETRNKRNNAINEILELNFQNYFSNFFNHLIELNEISLMLMGGVCFFDNLIEDFELMRKKSKPLREKVKVIDCYILN